MAASSSKPTLVHFSLVFFILTTAVFGLLYYVAEGGRAAAVAKSDEDSKKLGANTSDLNQANDNLQQCYGWLFGKTGAPATHKSDNPQDVNTVAGKVNLEHFGRYGQGVSEASYDAILRKLEETVRQTRDELTKRTDELAREHKIVLDLETKYGGQVASEKDARAKAEKDVQDQTRNKEEVAAQLEKDKADLRAAYEELEIRTGNEKIAWEAEKKGMVARLNNLAVLNQRLNDEVQKARKESFEVPTGFVRYVDTTNRLVYVDLGSADKLPLRMTFSVYSKSHSGVGRGKEDIKGSIEVTQIIDAHTSVCRINNEDIHNPITAGDPVFTPLWTPGQPKRIALIGKIDLNGDNISDREQLHSILATNGALVDAEVDDLGELKVRVKSDENPTGITEQTKFLVLGTLPDLAESTDADDTARIQKINVYLRDLQQAAREHGVRIITLSDFLAWMGFRAEMRLYKPGVEQPYTLTSGSRSPAVDTTKGNRASPGQTSSAVDPRKKDRKPASSNTLNKIFKGTR